jgi:hypothetical protein
MLGTLAGAALVVYGVTTVLSAPPAPRDATGGIDAGAGDPTSSGTAGVPSSTTPEDTLRLLGCPPVDGPAADPDGDGCPSPATIVGRVVEIDGVRYGVGAPGDTLALGDWDCDGSATVVAVRPATGEVFVFPAWAGTDRELVVPAAGHVVGADHAVADDPDGDGCASLVVVTRDGDRAEVPA